MLDHRVHVANVTQVLHTRIASGRTLVYLCGVGDLDGSDAGVDGAERLPDHLVGEVLVIFANFEDELVDGLSRRLLLAGGLSAEETVFPQELHLPLGHLRPQVEIRQQLGTALNGQLVPLVENVSEQHLGHGRDPLLLHTELGHQHSQDAEVLRSDIGKSDVLEHLGNVEVLLRA